MRNLSRRRWGARTLVPDASQLRYRSTAGAAAGRLHQRQLLAADGGGELAVMQLLAVLHRDRAADELDLLLDDVAAVPVDPDNQHVFEIDAQVREGGEAIDAGLHAAHLAPHQHRGIERLD